MNYDFDELLAQYSLLWNNRNLDGVDAKKTLLQTIETDLRDELTHPRLRKNYAEKFYIAVKRINHSHLDAISKCRLVDLHIEVMAEIQQSLNG
ncbi:hypothetical protein [Litchfieldia alkalitelluris]|uniref:hypothetical protein n=1 Tax=Litchfieldia alkalitelluris TaxID=304268 RepID=UPI000996EFDC|nr:hypothetical protein [Litchfieldia alkalitelluris]